MNELNEFLKVLSEAKKEKKEHIEEAKKDMDSFFDMVAQVKAQHSQSPKQQFLKQVKLNVQEDLNTLFNTLTEEKSTIEDVVEQNSVENIIEEVTVPEIKPAAEIYTKAEIDDLLKRNASFQQPDPKVVDPNFRAVQDKLKFLEQAIGRIAATGPGGGEVNLRWLDDVARETIADGRWLKYDEARKKFVFDEINPFQVVNNVTEVISTYYEVHEDDYYIGVNNTSAPVTIVLPESADSGRMLIIKDEDGDAETHPIIVQGLVDNDPEGFIIQINNGAVQLIYRAGCWRIV